MESFLERVGSTLTDMTASAQSVLYAGVQVPVRFVLPTDERSSRWEICEDFTSPAAVTQLSDALVPTQPNDSNPFFTSALRDLMAAVTTPRTETADERNHSRVDKPETRSEPGGNEADHALAGAALARPNNALS